MLLATDARTLVRDWDNVAIGYVDAAETDPRTRAVRALVVQLHPHLRGQLAQASQMLVPMRWVRGIRPGELTLDRSLGELRRLALHEGRPR
jgi:hypothetical protein